MSAVELTESFLAKAGGWEAVKRARSLLAQGSVLSSDWKPPVLKGVVQEGSISYRAGLVIKGGIDLENLCSCRDSRQWGTICAHSVAIGLHFLSPKPDAAMAAPTTGRPTTEDRKSAERKGTTTGSPLPPNREAKQLQRAAPNDPGEPAEIFIVFPPNLAQALSKGRVTVCLEGKWKSGRAPLNALPADVPFRFSTEDQALLQEVEHLGGGDTPAVLALGAEQFAGLLTRLVDHPRISFGRSQSAAVTASPWPATVRAQLESSGEIRLGLVSSGDAPALILGETSWVLRNHRFQPVGLPGTYFQLFQGSMLLSRSRVPEFLTRDWPIFRMNCELQANFRLEDFVLETQLPSFQLSLTGGLAQLQARLQCSYGPQVFALGNEPHPASIWWPDANSPMRYFARNVDSERMALARLMRAGFRGPDAQARYQLSGQNEVLNFFGREYPRLQKEWQVSLEERLDRSVAQNLERIEPRFQGTSSGEQWFELNLSYGTPGGERFSASDIQRLILSGQSHTRLKNGRIAVLDTGAVEELHEVLLDCSPQQERGVYRIENRQRAFLESTLNEEAGWRIQGPASGGSEAVGKASSLPVHAASSPRGSGGRMPPEPADKMSAPQLGSLESVLRPYQKHGVAWLHFLRRHQFGGILADEMGLGKTLQTLAFLETVVRCRESQNVGQASSLPVHAASLPRGSGGRMPPESADMMSAPQAQTRADNRRPSLVVCPSSLVFNWMAESRKFTPHLRVLALQGPRRREVFDQMPHADLVVTSYALIRRDADLYRGLEFDTMILDEAQHIKNRQTQNAQAVKGIRSRHRLVLTGTPLENSVLDLWSIFAFLMPGYLGSAKDFRERYEAPITRDKNTAVQNRLARRVRPFLLRRLKREVAPDLPQKIEQVAFCELTEDQQSVYRQVLEASRREVLEAVQTQGAARSRMILLTALLRLRQVCCDLRLLDLENTEPETASGKLELFQELLDEAIDGGHRVLVFSQFTRMLNLIRDRLFAGNVEHCYLDGATLNRAEVVGRFQSDAAIPVFLISLKAGGLGLNLTAADTVIHFDPWWNPAVEDQATDRAHRIGQTRVVTSYKLITRGTVEEKILTLQARKRETLGAILVGEEELAQALTWEEIQALLS
ncbi:MAG: SNF2 helicase associated domain-containing protein [Verrucomicrobia bacterium]|nr:SNF2 helicase associated domain-containing protein [Verrucomicrobiota bacterium]